MGLLDWLNKRGGSSAAPDGFQFGLDDPLAGEHGAISHLLVEYEHTHSSGSWYSIDLDKLPTFAQIAGLDRDPQARMVDALVQRLVSMREKVRAVRAAGGANFSSSPAWQSVWGRHRALTEVLSALLRRKLPLGEPEVNALLKWCADDPEAGSWSHPLSGIAGAAENFAAQTPLSEDTKTLLARFLERLQAPGYHQKELRKVADRMVALLGLEPELPIEPGEAWADAALLELQALPSAIRGKWTELLAHSRAAAGGSPSAKWTKAAVKLLGAVGHENFAASVARWYPLTERRRTAPTLSDHQWRVRCAARAFERAAGVLSAAFANTHGAGTRFYDVYSKIGDEVRRAEDPWHYLRTFPLQDTVREHFGTGAPPFDLPPEPPAYDPPEDLFLSEGNMDLLRGLAWISGLQEDRDVARALTALALSAYRKVPGRGPRAVRVGNACITALGMMPGLDAVGQLALLKVKVKFGTAQVAIGKALNAAAEREGLPREELEEMAVPAYGLTEVGRLVETLGEFTAELEVTGSKSAGITWRRADGKVQKSLPATVKKEFAEELKDLNAAKKDIENMLPAQVERIDALFLQQKSWPLETWRERYLEHPLIGTLARRLIWNFTTDGTTTPGLWLNGKLVDRLGHPMPLDSARSTVALWHPLDQPPDVVLGWRGFLEEWQIVQPFKQAHREVYLLTPAEERTRTYSNRFAAHILKQHQFHALAAARGWKNKLRLMVDADYPPATRLLPQWWLRAEFWIEGAGDQYGTDTNETGTYLYLATDQVRFYRLDDAQVSAHAGGGGYGAGWQQAVVAEPVPLAEIPPLVFSEIMRDVDLFVGVASVGNDPAWADGGRREAERNAWNLHAFGDLSATAQTRRELLQRLVPKLKIADRCSFAEKFLVVRGDLRTYKIHLGSGNILMSPNDRYLCIVPGAGRAEDGKVFLPFEGDRTLSVILSKAFLLAADAKITDPSITGQIGRG